MKQHLAFFDPKLWSSWSSAERPDLPKIDRIDSWALLENKILVETREELKDFRQEITPKESEATVVTAEENAPESGEHSAEQTEVTPTDTRRGNESMGTAVETVDVSGDYEELSRILRNLARNKNLNYEWTNDSWKWSAKETKLAIASAKVFQELLSARTLQKMVDVCKNHKWEMDKQEAEALKAELNINSDPRDIQSFYKSYQEYQNRNTEFKHLSDLMNFFLTQGIETIDDLKEKLSTWSKKITNTEISRMWDRLFRKVTGRETYFDAYMQQEVNHRPADWKEKSSFQIIKDRLNVEWNGMLQMDKMLALLWDFNLDWEVNSGDNGTKKWNQIADIFRRSTIDVGNSEFNSDSAVRNLVAYANKFWLGLPTNISSVDSLYNWMIKWPEWYENTRKLQNFVKNLPIDLGDVLRNWENAWQESLSNMTSALKLEQQEREAAEKAAKEKAEEIVKSWEEKLKEVIKDVNDRANITQQLLAQLPWMLIEKALEQQWGLAVWAAVPLDQLIKWVSAGFNVWIDSNGKPTFWLFIGWDHRFNLSDSAGLSTAISAGTNLGFIPCVAASLELWVDANKKYREKSLDAKWEWIITLWANVALYWTIFSRWVSAWYENNKQAGIEKNTINIKNQINDLMSNPKDGLLNDIQNLSEEKVEEWLSNRFPGSSAEELQAATANIMSIIKHFKIDEKTTPDDVKLYAQVIADTFAEQWRNNALTWIADNKRKLSGWKVWVQFFAWYIPTVVAVAKFTKYYNARTVESEHSAARRVDAAVNGAWNRSIDLWESKEVWSSQVSQINKVLELYWASKDSLKYLGWKDGKQWRISVPASLENWMWVNVRVAETMKWYVRAEADWSYSFPANAVYRLFEERGWDLKSVTLNIGSDRNNESDVSLSNKEWMDAFIWDKELMWTKRYEFKEWDPVSVENGLSYEPDILKEIFTDDVINSLKTVDSSNRRKFSEFMKTKRDSNASFESMVNALKNVLWKDKKYEKIVARLDNPSTSSEEKQLIIDRIMAISADANVHQKWWLEAVVNGNKEVRWRWDYYKKETMVWPNGKPIFSEINVDRDALVKKIHESNNYNAELQTNLLWATAFYHKNNTAKGLAMTWLWATTILWWQMTEISGADRTKVESWFLGNEGDSYTPWVLEKSPAELSNVKRIVSDYITRQGIEFRTDAWVGRLTDAQLKDLLKWKNIELNLDNSQEKVIVNLDVKYMFYLMWECANESVGMQLWKLWIKRQVEVEDYKEWSLFFNDVEWSSSVQISRRDAAVGVAFKAGKQWGENDAETNPGEDEEDIPWDWTTTPWATDWWSTGTWWTPNEWWEWTWGSQWGWRNGEGWGDNNQPPVWWEWQWGHQWGWR